MTKSLIRLTTLAMLSAAIAAPSLSTAFAAGSDTPSTPPASDSKKGSKDKKHNETRPDERAFLDAYRTAYVTIYDKHDYTSAIAQLKALKQDDRADVANLIGYSYRKLGDYKVSQAYYERALKADPNHARTWQYYGLWQIEQGNRDQAQYHLSKLASLTGKDSAEYKSLSDALAQTPGTGLTY
ncbi:tetratricopeptide repeat protein [Tardiphaga alba]|uniref:Tetratricopeptide repeat protein n=1 Tax=Tardiphaga alba TaxID=340268 RepID=A0ABX8AA19_9BRAD|nr:tetratricopeptide repeat protein [Tardiphaga alba]QUS40619.1 tetratricopeptide repeat protein [Tardiphaga alba]